MKLKFTKMHGLGNDFILINNLAGKYDLSTGQVKFFCDRKLGVGCDQLLLIEPATDTSSDFYYRIYNSDGSLAGQCGNGARCFISYVVNRGLTTKTKVQLQTRDRIIHGRMLDNGLVEVGMGQPNFEPQQIPLLSQAAERYRYTAAEVTFEFGAVSMGNPHAVIYLTAESELWDDSLLARYAEALQKSQLFPESVNVNFVFIENRRLIQLRTYERGCGFTLACGSGACASSAVAIRDSLTDSSVTVSMPGGDLEIEWQGGDLLMRGSATHVFDGELTL